MFLTVLMKKSELVQSLPAGHGAAGGLWTLRAIAAIELDAKRDAWEAGEQMKRLGLDASDNELVRELVRKTFVMLDRSELLDASSPLVKQFVQDRQRLDQAKELVKSGSFEAAEEALAELAATAPDYTAAAVLRESIDKRGGPALAAKRRQKKQYASPPAMSINPKKNYTATVSTTLGDISVELWPEVAPNHVNSFIFLSREGYYDGVIFHRVIPGFMIQGGDPSGTGTGGPGYQLKAEFNDRKHTRGVLSAARTNDPDSAGSQFFIMHGDGPQLDGKYTAFGEVTSGMEVVDKIATQATGANDRPKDPAKINTIRVKEQAPSTRPRRR
jgi:cyclophilin family peptidyl-prolyl cis-trans isomerase